MKVIDGGFGGGTEEPSERPGERLREQLDRCKYDDIKEGEYLLLTDTGDTLMMLSNYQSPADVLMMLKKAEIAIMTAEFEHPAVPPAS